MQRSKILLTINLFIISSKIYFYYNNTTYLNRKSISINYLHLKQGCLNSINYKIKFFPMIINKLAMDKTDFAVPISEIIEFI